jgi:hypothetical protein
MESFWDSEEKMKTRADLVNVDYSTLSRKASDVPYEIWKKLLLEQLPPEWILTLFEVLRERFWEVSLY